MNAHLEGRATYRGEDVVKLVCEEGVEKLEDFWEELDEVDELTYMQKVTAAPDGLKFRPMNTDHN